MKPILYFVVIWLSAVTFGGAVAAMADAFTKECACACPADREPVNYKDCARLQFDSFTHCAHDELLCEQIYDSGLELCRIHYGK